MQEWAQIFNGAIQIVNYHLFSIVYPLFLRNHRKNSAWFRMGLTSSRAAEQTSCSLFAYFFTCKASEREVKL
jgi:hypothetical protein